MLCVGVLKRAESRELEGVSFVAYLALARKYRPSKFEEVIGQDHVIRTLSNAIRLERVHHAFLFTGARGVGKTTMARALARALNCETGATASPCGKCSLCHEIAAGTSIDVLEIDGASNTGVDRVRDLRDNVRFLPAKARTKIYIIDEVHMLSTAAFNALLKTLEEPPPHVKFIFATTEPQKIPITILSRCQRFDFRKVGSKELTKHFESVLERESVELSDRALAAVVRQARGSVRDGMSLLDQVLSFAGDSAQDDEIFEALGVVDRSVMGRLVSALQAKNATEALAIVRDLDNRGHDPHEVAQALAGYCRDLAVILGTEGQAEALIDYAPSERADILSQAKSLELSTTQRWFKIILDSSQDIAQASWPLWALEMAVLRLVEVEPARSVTSLLERLATLADGAPESAHQAIPAREVANAEQHDSSRTNDADNPETRGQAEEPPSSPAVETKAEEPARLADAESYSSWRSLLSKVQSESPQLAATLRYAHLVEFGPGGIELAFAPGDAFHAETAQEKQNREILRDVISSFFGSEVSITWSILTADQAERSQNLIEQRELAAQAHEAQIKTEAVQHPSVMGALEILKGSVVDVKALEEFQEEE